MAKDDNRRTFKMKRRRAQASKKLSAARKVALVIAQRRGTPVVASGAHVAHGHKK